jgi:hypothetical protein
MRRCIQWIVLVALAAPAFAFAAECDFRTQGDPRNGMGLAARMPISGTTVSSALGQLRKAGHERNLSVGYDLIEGDIGQLYFIQKDSKTAIVLQSEASRQGIMLVAKLSRDQAIDLDATKALMCGMLESVQPGAKGDAVAAEARQTDSAMFTPTSVDAVQLSTDLGKEGKRVLRDLDPGSARLTGILWGASAHHDAVARVDQMAVFGPFMATYLGRPYRVDGEVYSLKVNKYAKGGPVAEIIFLVTKKSLLGRRWGDNTNGSEFGVKCVIQSGQEASIATLRAHDFVTLTGRVSSISPNDVTLSGCHQ